MSDTPRVIVLVATIPARRRTCERLLAELAKQSRVPDGVVLVLDGYGDEMPAPACPLLILAEVRTAEMSGAGNRWRCVTDFAPDDVIICLDDDTMLCEAPTLVAALTMAVVASGGASAAMGFSANGKSAPPGVHSRGDLIYAAGCGLTVRCKHLDGLEAFAKAVVAEGGPDALGVHGDDDALVSAYLWKRGVNIRHAATGNIFPAPNTRTTSQTEAKAKQQIDSNAQKLAIKKITGWPWFVSTPVGGNQHVRR